MATQKRATLKTSILKIAKFSKEMTEEVDLCELQSVSERLINLFKRYEDFHMEILETTGKENLEFERIEYEDTEALVMQTTVTLKRAILSHTPMPETRQQHSDNYQNRRQPRDEEDQSDFSGLRVPRVSVPEFSGSYLEWPSFRDLFTSLVGDNPKVPKVQKLSYLKKVVVGDTGKLIKNIKITSDNFEAAWDILQNRFENPRVIIEELLNNIFTIPIAKGDADGIKLILDTTLESLRELNNLNRPVDDYDDWLVFIIVRKLDPLSLEKWNEAIGEKRDVIGWKMLEEFLNVRFRILEGKAKAVELPSTSKLLSSKSSTNKVSFAEIKSSCHLTESRAKSNNLKCYYCKGAHRAKACNTFKKKNPAERRLIVESANLCSNCLSPNHKLAECASTRSCFKCGLQHHSMLHMDLAQKNKSSEKRSEAAKALESTSSSSSTSLSNNLLERNPIAGEVIFLATAIITVNVGSGKKVYLQALLDQGSQMSLISTYAAKRLHLLIQKYSGIPLVAAGGKEIDVDGGIVNFSFNSRVNDSMFQTNALVVDIVSQYQLGDRDALPKITEFLNGLTLADPNFDKPNRIDVLLAGDVYGQVVQKGIKKFQGILVQNTSLGWIVSGKYVKSCLLPALCIHQLNFPVEKLLRSFWEIEELPTEAKSLLSINEMACERHFQETHYRNKSGRYVVRLPFKPNERGNTLGFSRGLAISSQIRVENRFKKNQMLRKKYVQFMQESIQLGHMELVKEKDLEKPPSQCFYMPHHAVLTQSATTSLRVVFNASQKSSSGYSLNDLLLTGPKLQSHLFDILIRCRKNWVCYMSDVEKMYRRILVNKKDRDFQRILWREDSNQKMRTYRMRVVTDGTSSAPFLAIRTVRQLADDEKKNFPLAYESLVSDMFMDDLVSGNSSVASGVEHIRDINNIFISAGMRMRKWTSNVDAVLREVPREDRQSSPIEFGQTDYVKVLGIQWLPSDDCFGFKVRLPPAEDTTTKRQLLSHASKLFDPLGFLSPCTIIPKILFQKLWELKLDWDDPLPEYIKKRWIKFRNELLLLESLKIPRFIGNSSGSFEIHGFSDAANPAYSAAVYSRIQNPDGSIEVKLLAGKTKVTPVKKINIHCAELCGALLVSRLLQKISISLKVDGVIMYGWTDSEIVLNWLNKSPGVWQQFVGNRTSIILEIVPFQQWNYVDTKENPADCASRGILPNKLVEHSLWWNGPKWLSEDKSKWPSNVNPIQLSPTNMMRKKSVMNLVTVNSSTINPSIQLLERFSSLQRLIRITAWCFRFINKLRRRLIDRSIECQSSAHLPDKGLRGINENLHHGGQRKCLSRHQEIIDRKSITFLTAAELKHSLTVWIKIVQGFAFKAEIRRLQLGKTIRSGPLRKLNPKFDHLEEIIRVGGRLTNAHISYDRKFPIVLPKISHFTQLLIADAHTKTLHGNVQLMLHCLRQNYWILDSRRIVRSFVKNRCKTCIKWSATRQKQQMAALPRPRVQPSTAFTHTGVDFTGPVYIKNRGRGKNQSLAKGYIAIYICLSTRAVHLEVAEDMSTNEFIETHKRFVSRRGIPFKMYSDNGSNFVGATTELTKAQERAMYEQFKEIAALLANDGIEWEFNPPTASHFGGLWEAAVKSMKYHLKRIVGSAHLTYKEMTTLLCQIECAMNSRPICSLTDDPDDLNFLTPGHFTMGKNPSSLPEESLLEINENRLTKWQRIQQMYQNYWRHWSQEYLSNLQHRSKWFDKEDNLKVGELVILKEDNLPPTKWLMGRVIEVHPGSDELVRSVTVRLKCKHHKLTRPIDKLCRLPFLKSDELNVGM